jgi:hypothetical protein
VIAATIGVALAFGALALMLRPGGALSMIIMCMLVWPEFLRIPIGPAAMSAPRIVALFLLFRLLRQGRLRKANLGWVDFFVIVGWIWTTFATMIADADSSQVFQMIGRGFDTVIVYFAARLAIFSDDDMKFIMLPLAATAIIMCVAGVMESMLIFTPYSVFNSYLSWDAASGDGQFRLGFLRARASTTVHIYFGIAMAVVAGLVWSFALYFQARFIGLIAVGAAFIAALSAMSSGPWLALGMLVFFNSYALRPSLIKPSLFMLLMMSVAMELLSNRHFYNLIDYLALNSHTAWYRTRLLEVAVSHWQDFWLVGVGSNWPNYWALSIDARSHIDVVNHFLIIGLYGGVPGIIMYILSHVIAIRRGVHAWRNTSDIRRKRMIFGLGATLMALDVASMSVGLFGPPLLLSFILLGILVSISVAWQDAPQENNSVAEARQNLVTSDI